MNDMDKALYCYENTLRHNPFCLQALVKAATIYHTREQYPKVRLSSMNFRDNFPSNVIPYGPFLVNFTSGG